MVRNQTCETVVQTNGELESIVCHVRKRLADQELPVGVVLVSLLNAIDAASESDQAVTWLYRVLRHASEGCRRGSEWNEEALFNDAAAADEEQKFVGQWFRATLPLLEPRSAEILERVDLGGESIAEVAADLHLPANSVDIRLRRARRDLRRHLEQTCIARTEEPLL